MDKITDEYIQKLVNDHKKKLQYHRDRYNNIRKHDETFMKKNRDRAKVHYDNNKEKKKEYYESNKALMNAKASYKYYLKNDKVDKFKEKYNDRYELLLNSGFITQPAHHHHHQPQPSQPVEAEV